MEDRKGFMDNCIKSGNGGVEEKLCGTRLFFLCFSATCVTWVRLHPLHVTGSV